MIAYAPVGSADTAMGWTRERANGIWTDGTAL